MFGNTLRYSEILSLLGLIQRKQKLQGSDQIHPFEETLEELAC